MFKVAKKSNEKPYAPKVIKFGKKGPMPSGSNKKALFSAALKDKSY